MIVLFFAKTFFFFYFTKKRTLWKKGLFTSKILKKYAATFFHEN